MGFQLIRPEALRQDEEWPAPLRVLEPHQQMVIVVLSNEANDVYSRWSAMRATLPLGLRKDDPMIADKQRYYRMVLPLDPDKPFLSAHPLTWTPISHVIWDGMPPERDRRGAAASDASTGSIGAARLVIAGGAGPAFAPLRESFLAPLPPRRTLGRERQPVGRAMRRAWPKAPIRPRWSRSSPTGK